MNTKLKKALITIATTLSAILLVTTATYTIGTLTPSGTAGDATQYTLNDIYTKLTTGIGVELGSDTGFLQKVCSNVNTDSPRVGVYYSLNSFL